VLDEEDELKKMVKITDEVMRKNTIQMPVVEPSSSRAEATESTASSKNLSKDQDVRKGKQETVVLPTENSEYQDIEAGTETEGLLRSGLSMPRTRSIRRYIWRTNLSVRGRVKMTSSI
jgi:hypothetical protein